MRELEARILVTAECAHEPGLKMCGVVGCQVHEGVQGPVPKDARTKCAALTTKGRPCSLNHVKGSRVCKKHHNAVLADDDNETACIFLEPLPPCTEPCSDPEAAVGSKERYFCAKHSESQSLGVKYCDADGNYLYSLPTLRNNTLTADSALKDTELEWQKEIPYDTRQGAIKKYASAQKAFFALVKVDPDAKPPGFLTKKRSTAIFSVRSNAISYSPARGLRVFPSRFKQPLRLRKKDEKKVVKAFAEGGICDSEMMCDTSGRWYILLVVKGSVAARPSEKPYGPVYMDPGGRTMDTFYSPDGVAGKLGDGFYDLILPLLVRADDATGKNDRYKAEGLKTARTRRRLRIRAQALRTKVRDTVRDLHRKMCRFLCDNFSTIYLPPFTGAAVSSVRGRTIGSKVVRNLMTFAHGEFRVFLHQYAAARGVTVEIVSEAFTTKTCTACGRLNEVGAASVVRCGCGLTIDRDLTAARNTGLRSACSKEQYMSVQTGGGVGG